MTFKFPKSALPPQPTLRERMNRDMTASEGFNKLRGLLRKAMEDEQREYQAIMDKAAAEHTRTAQEDSITYGDTETAGRVKSD